MNVTDIIILLIVSISLLAALKTIIKSNINKKKKGCNGQCFNCDRCH